MTLVPQGLRPALDACTQSSLFSSVSRHVVDAADRYTRQDIGMLYQGHTEDSVLVTIRCRLRHKEVNKVKVIADPPIRACRLDALQAAFPPGGKAVSGPTPCA